MPDGSIPRLPGDVGGMRARFAWMAHAGAPVSPVAAHRCARFETAHDAIRQDLREHDEPAPPWCATGIANPITGDQVRKTNHA